MATRRTTRKAAEPTAAPEAKPALTAQDLARFLGLKDYNADQMQALLAAASDQAQQFLGIEISPEKQGHVYQQGILHLAAKFYAAGTSKVEQPGDLPTVCRYFFELVRREQLSDSAQ